MAIQKFKVGDKVIGNHPDRYFYTKKGWVGEVKKVYGDGKIEVYGDCGNRKQTFTVEPQYFDLVTTNEYKPGDLVVIEKSNIESFESYAGKIGTVVRGPEGSNFKYLIAVDGTKIWCNIKCHASEKIVITHDGKTTTATMYCADGSKKTATARCAPEDTFDFKVGANLAMERLIGKTETKVEVKPEPPEYYNGKVVCIESEDSCFTVGKIYEIVDGKFTDNGGSTRPMTNDRVSEVKDLTTGYFKNWVYKFIPLVEDQNKPLTTEELRKMDGKRVWLSSLVDGEENFDDNHCGWHTVSAATGKVIDSHYRSYKLTDNGDHYGFRAYRNPPTK